MPETKKRIMILKTRDISFISESEIRNRRLPKPGIDLGVSEAQNETWFWKNNIFQTKTKSENALRTIQKLRTDSKTFETQNRNEILKNEIRNRRCPKTKPENYNCQFMVYDLPLKKTSQPDVTNRTKHLVEEFRIDFKTSGTQQRHVIL